MSKIVKPSGGSALPFGIYDETDKLKAAVTWGPVGAEAILAQFLPPRISLFLDKMDVLKARQEGLDYAKSLNQHGVKVFFARDIIAQQLKPQSLSFETVLSILFQRAEDLKKRYGHQVELKNYKEIIEQLLSQDVERYGRNKALTLNWKLSLYPTLPLGNLIYARDQMNILLSKRIRSHMKKAIRRPEIEFYELVYREVFGRDHKTIVLPLNETFEGGDAFIHDKTIYVGVGPRTSMGAALHIFRMLESDIRDLSYKFAIVYDKNWKKRAFSEQMFFMHLDTFANPVGRRQIALCLSEAKMRKVILIERVDGKIKLEPTGKSLLDYIFEDGQEIIAIPEEEQQSFGCNFLALDEKTIFVPIQTNKKTIAGLADAGKNIIYTPLDESTKGFGGAHCMTGQLFREASGRGVLK